MLSRLRSPDQWWLFLRVLTFATAVPLLFNLRLSVLSRVLERRIRSARQRRHDSINSDQIIRSVEIVRAIGQPLVRPHCLIRAVTLYYFLRRAGMDLSLCFGAARKEGQLVEAAGHCWLPGEIAPVIARIRESFAADGTGFKEPQPSERDDRAWRADPSDGMRPLKAVRAVWEPDQ